jgi:hypothetical protein
MDDYNERWLPVVGFEGLYEVSDLGRVRSLPHPRRVRGGGTAMHCGRLLKPYPQTKEGHLIVVLSSCNVQERHYVHRLALEAFVGPCPPGLECRHFPDRDPANNRLDNLSWGTKTENAQDQQVHGTNRNTNKTHCPLRHEYTPENTYLYLNKKTGVTSRICRECQRTRNRERMRAIAAQRPRSGHGA